MDTYDNGRDIDFWAILKFLFTKWKSILIVAIVGLIIAAGYMILSSTDTDGSTSVSGIEVVESPEYIAAKQTFETCKQRIETIEKLIIESAFMEIDPYGTYKGTLAYVVEGNQQDLLGINMMLYSYVYDGQLKNQLAEVGPYTVKDLETLVGVVQDINQNIVLTPGTTGQVTLRVSILAKDEEEAHTLMSYMDTFLRGYMDGLKLQGTITSYSTITAEVKDVISMAIAEQQSILREKYNNEKSNLETYKEKLAEVEPPAPVISEEEGVDTTTLIKYGGAGFVLGAVLAMIVWVLIYLLSGRLYAVIDKERCLKVKHISTIYDFRNIKGLDLWIGHKLSGVYSRISLDEQRDVASMNIKNELLKRDDVKKVFLTSSWCHAQEEMQLIKNELESAGYLVECEGQIIGKPDALKLASGCDISIILESNNDSRTDVVREEIQVLEKYVGDILGMVLIQHKL